MLDPSTDARLEGLKIEADLALEAFHGAARSTLENMRLCIIRDFPEFYSRRECIEAGVPLWRRWWKCR